MKTIALFLFLTIFLSACTKEMDNTPPPPLEHSAQTMEVMPLRAYSPAPMEPAQGVFTGADITADRITRGDIDAFEMLTAHSHSVYAHTIKNGDPYPLTFILECLSRGKVAEITILPANSQNPFDYSIIDKMAESFSVLETPIFINFYPDPLSFTQDPNGYRTYYEYARAAFRRYAPQAAFVYSVRGPNVYTSVKFEPADAAYDWAGIYLLKSFETEEENFYAPLDFFYAMTAAKKPLMLHTGFSHFSTGTSTYYESECAKALTTLYATLKDTYPQIKAVIYIDESYAGVAPLMADVNNYSISANKHVLSAYTQSVSEPYYIVDNSVDNS